MFFFKTSPAAIFEFWSLYILKKIRNYDEDGDDLLKVDEFLCLFQDR